MPLNTLATPSPQHSPYLHLSPLSHLHISYAQNYSTPVSPRIWNVQSEQVSAPSVTVRPNESQARTLLYRRSTVTSRNPSSSSSDDEPSHRPFRTQSSTQTNTTRAASHRDAGAKYHTALARSRYPLNVDNPYMSYFEVRCIAACLCTCIGIMRANRMTADDTDPWDETSELIESGAPLPNTRVLRRMIEQERIRRRALLERQQRSESDEDELLEEESVEDVMEEESASSSEDDAQSAEEDEETVTQWIHERLLMSLIRASTNGGVRENASAGVAQRASAQQHPISNPSAPTPTPLSSRQGVRRNTAAQSSTTPLSSLETYHMDYTNAAPGFTNHSFGWLSTNGHLYNGTQLSQSGSNYSLQQLFTRPQSRAHDLNTRGTAFSSPWGEEGDIVGIGIIWNQSRIFFTKNGQSVGEVRFGELEKNAMRDRYYAVCALHQQGESLEFNFGQKPFAYDLRRRMRSERLLYERTLLEQCKSRRLSAHASPIRKSVAVNGGVSNSLPHTESLPVASPMSETRFVHCIIQRYLYEMGYRDTLRAFEKSANLEELPCDSYLDLRQELREHIEKGQAQEALQRIMQELERNGNLLYSLQSTVVGGDTHHHKSAAHKKFSHKVSALTQLYHTTLLHLHAQCAIEMLRENSDESTIRAVMYMRQHLGAVMSDSRAAYREEDFSPSGWPLRADMRFHSSATSKLPKNHPSRLVSASDKEYVIQLCSVLAMERGVVDLRLQQQGQSHPLSTYFTQDHRTKLARMVCALILAARDLQIGGGLQSVVVDGSVAMERLCQQERLVMSLLGCGGGGNLSV